MAQFTGLSMVVGLFFNILFLVWYLLKENDWKCCKENDKEQHILINNNKKKKTEKEE